MAILHHGTTRWRAERILANGPDADFVEPGGGPRAEQFSACFESGPFHFGTPEEYAQRKAKNFPNEGGAVILVMDVPDDLIALAVDPAFLPVSQGTVQFEQGWGLDELLAAWATISMHILAVDIP